jgi:MoxR-like ATPase
VRRRAPGANERLALQAVEFVQRMRKADLFKLPGVAETIDWTNALVALNVMSLEPDAVRDTLGVLLKYQDDVEKLLDGEAARLLDELRAAALLP